MLPALVLLVVPSLAAQAPPPIQDNSFLIEEAYNQERGVVQHISVFAWERKSRDWSFGFTQEWPFRSQHHQLSYTVSLLRAGAAAGPGDVFLNYRIQAFGGRGARVWIAPRLSAIVPTGSWRAGRGDGVVGWEVRLPGSFELASWASLHLNAGVTLHPSARSTAGDRATLVDAMGGASVIFMLRPTLNVLLESVVQNGAAVIGPGQTTRSTSVVLSPGVRWAHNSASGLQIVPGAAYTIGLGDASERSGLLLYLSFEHSFRRE
jgi:hypothetical protein